MNNTVKFLFVVDDKIFSNLLILNSPILEVYNNFKEDILKNNEIDLDDGIYVGEFIEKYHDTDYYGDKESFYDIVNIKYICNINDVFNLGEFKTLEEKMEQIIKIGEELNERNC